MEKDTLLPLLVGALMLATIGLIAAVGILAYLLFKKTSGEKKHESSPEVANEITVVEEPQTPSAYAEHTQGLCANHPDIIAQGMCAICAELFCETCLKAYEMLHFCNEHYELFINHKWVEIETVKTSPNDPESGLSLYTHKEKMWRERKIPSYIMTHYKIDIENDLIESHIKLYAMDSDRQTVQRSSNSKREHQ